MKYAYIVLLVLVLVNVSKQVWLSNMLFVTKASVQVILICGVVLYIINKLEDNESD